MRIICWNINSYTRRINIFQNLVNYYTPEIICLQETRTQKNIEVEGYLCFNYFAKNRRGTSIFFSQDCLKLSKPKLIQHRRILRKDTTRFIHVLWNDIHIINVYVPLGAPSTKERENLVSIFGPGKTDHTNYMNSVQYIYKLKFLNKIKRIAEYYHSKKKRVILCGDFNLCNIRDMVKGIKPKAIVGSARKYAEGIYRVYGSTINIYENYLYNCDLGEYYDSLCKKFIDRGSLIKYMETYVGYVDYLRLRVDYFFTNFYTPGMSYKVLINFATLEGRSDHVPLLLNF